MILVGLSGPIGSGKTTFAEFLAANSARHGHWESWEVIAEVANKLRQQQLMFKHTTDLEGLTRWLEPLPTAVASVTGLAMNAELANITTTKVRAQPDLYTKLFEYAGLVSDDRELQKGPITLESKEQFRSLLQWLGGYLAKTIDGGMWYNEIVRRIQAQSALELATIGGVRFPADAAALRNAGGYVLRIERSKEHVTQDAADITERESHLITPDAIIYNTSNLRNLKACAGRVYADLLSGKLDPSYSSAK